MKLVSHKAVGISTALVLNFDVYGVVLTAFGAILPDLLDTAIAGKNRQLWAKIHRKVSHWWVLWGALLFVALNIPLGDYRINMAAYCFAVGAFSHLACDLLTPMGLPVFNPFKTGTASLNIIRTGSTGEYLIVTLVTTVVSAWKMYERGLINF